MVSKLKLWVLKKIIKNNKCEQFIESLIKDNCIAYNNWVGSLNKTGFPTNDNGTWMDCWQLYDIYKKRKERSSFLIHAKKW